MENEIKSESISAPVETKSINFEKYPLPEICLFTEIISNSAKSLNLSRKPIIFIKPIPLPYNL